MANNIRPIIVLENKSLIVWEELEDVEIYKFKLVRKDNPSVSVWEFIKRRSDLKKPDSKFLQFELPALDELVPFLIIGEAESALGRVHAQSEVIYLESETTKSFENLKKSVIELYTKNEKIASEPDTNLVTNFREFVHFFTMGSPVLIRSHAQELAIWNIDEFSQFCHRISFSLKSDY
jgi:hypothetical protein